MKTKTLFIFLSFIFINFLHSQNRKSSCENSSYVNQTEICFPSIKGMTNISKNIKYVNFIKNITFQNNEMLSVYLDDVSINSDPYSSSDMASIYVHSKNKNDISISLFNEMALKMGSFLKKSDNLSSIIKDLDRNYLRNISLDSPILIESYSLNERVKTYLILGKKTVNNKEIVTLTTLNLMYISKKMILSNYAIEYINSGSINSIKQKNDYFVFRILNENN